MVVYGDLMELHGISTWLSEIWWHLNVVQLRLVVKKGINHRAIGTSQAPASWYPCGHKTCGIYLGYTWDMINDGFSRYS
jgi:hypothetical protein